MMSTCCSNDIILSLVAIVAAVCIVQSSSQQATDDHNPDCNYNVEMVWSAECGSGVISATPLVADIDSDGSLDIVTASFTEEISVIRGDTGQVPRQQSHWPFRFPGATFHSSPLLYDIDHNGQDEVLLTTSDGEILFLSSKGYQLPDRVLKVAHVVVKKYWYDLEISIDPTDIHSVLYKQEDQPNSKRSDVVNRKSGTFHDADYVSVDAHVLATPVIADLNSDGRREELVIPVTYYFDKQAYSVAEHIDGLEHINVENYLASGIVLFNLTSGEVLFEALLELTKVSAEFPAYQLFTPTVVDLDGNSGPLEIVVCTSAGHLIVLDCEGRLRPGFPKSFGTIHGQVTVEDLDGRDGMELILIDNSGNVMCLNAAGDEVWEADMSGTSSAGSRVVDLDGDGKLDVIVASDDGSVWAFKGDSGVVIEGWPHQLGGRITSNVLVTNLQPDVSNVDIIVLGHDGLLYILASSGRCVQVIELGEYSLVQVLSANLADNNAGLEIVMATMDGTVLCLAVGNDGKVGQSLATDWRSETPTLNQFTFWNRQFEVVVADDFREVTGATFDVDIKIQDTRPEQYRWKSYYIMIHAGGYQLQEKMALPSTGSHRLTVRCPPHPLQATVTVRLTNEFAQEISTTFTARFNMQWQYDVKWLLMLPFTSLLLLLLLVFGFPEADLLPTIHSSKDS